MDFQQLSHIAQLNKYGSITKLCEETYISRQTVSARIKALENELGFEILQRSKRGVTFTENGQRVLEFANLVLREYAILCHEIVIEETSALKDDLRISCAKSVEKISSVIINIFLKQNPEVKLFYSNDNNITIFDNVYNEQSDIGLMIRIKGFPTHEEYFKEKLDFYPIFDCQTHAWLNSSSKLCRQKELNIEEALTLPLIIDTAKDSMQTQEIFQEYSQTRIISGISNGTVIANLIANNKGIILDFFFGDKWGYNESYDKYNKHITHRLVNGDRIRTFGYVLKKGKTITPETAEFIKVLEAQT